MDTTVKRIALLLLGTAFVGFGNARLEAAERGTLVREAVIYLTPDASSNKLGQAERGRELVLLDRTPKWLHVEALLGLSRTPDPAFVLEEEDEGKTMSGWVVDTGIVWASTPNGDRILYGAAVDAEDEASRRHGRRGADQEAVRLYRRVFELFLLPRWPAKDCIEPPISNGRLRRRTSCRVRRRARRNRTCGKALTKRR